MGRFSLAAAAAGLLLGLASALDTSVTVSLGKITGAHCASGESVLSFKGIPFAEAPTGTRRWAAPVAYGKISKFPTAGLDATNYGYMCPQGAGEYESEDCLSLNVWAPANATATSKLPVRFYIHGGGFQQGSGSDDSYDGCRGASDGNVVMVTINYRLGILGFMALPELKDSAANGTVGNWGLLDQQLALKWVKDNIAAFGGDPNKMAVYGESAGAYSLLLHMVATGSKGLFSSAVSFSGSADAMAVDLLPDAYKKGQVVAAALNCSTASIATARGYQDVADCLRNSATPASIGAIMATYLTTTIQYLVPVVDGVVFTKHPVLLMREGKSATVPITLVTNAREGILEISGEVQKNVSLDTSADFISIMRRFVSVPKSFAAKVATQYDKAKYGDSLYFSAIFALTDVGYHCPALRTASAMAAQGLTVRLMQLQMARPTNGCPLQLGAGYPAYLYELWDAFHSYDIPFTFMIPYTAADVCNFTSAERDLSSFMSGMVSAVAATGAPVPARSASLTAPQLLNLTWPAWTPLQSQLILDMDVNAPKLIDTADWKSTCQIWDDILSSNIALGTQDPDALPPPAARSPPPPPGSSAAVVVASAWALWLPAALTALALLF